MCGFIIVLIIIALVLLIPASYMMGIVRGVAHKKENMEDDAKVVIVDSPDAAAVVPASALTAEAAQSAQSTGVTKLTKAVGKKCTSCGKARLCARAHGSIMSVHCGR